MVNQSSNRVRVNCQSFSRPFDRLSTLPRFLSSFHALSSTLFKSNRLRRNFLWNPKRKNSVLTNLFSNSAMVREVDCWIDSLPFDRTDLKSRHRKQQRAKYGRRPAFVSSSGSFIDFFCLAFFFRVHLRSVFFLGIARAQCHSFACWRKKKRNPFVSDDGRRWEWGWRELPRKNTHTHTQTHSHQLQHTHRPTWGSPWFCCSRKKKHIQCKTGVVSAQLFSSPWRANGFICSRFDSRFLFSSLVFSVHWFPPLPLFFSCCVCYSTRFRH